MIIYMIIDYIWNNDYFSDSIPYETCLTQDVASLEYFNCQPASCSPSEEKCNTSAPMEIYQCITGGYIVKSEC